MRGGIVRIALPGSCWPDQAALDTAARTLHQRYGGLDGVPDRVTGNQRDVGRPPGEVRLDLNVRRLDLGLTN